MSKPLAISLAGGGRVIVVTPDTVRQAFFHFIQVNQLTAPSVHGFNLPRFRSREANSTAVDRLFRRLSYNGSRYADGSSYRLDPCEIDGVERHMNRLLIDQNARLVDGEGVIRTGAVPGRQGKGSRRKVTYVLRYGMIFELTPLNRNALLRGAVRDIMIENADRRIELVRFWDVCVDRREPRILVRLSPRLDLRRVWRLPLERFRTRRLFDVRAAVPFEGFHFVARMPLASGKDQPLGRRVHLDRTNRDEALEPMVVNSNDPLCDALFPIDPDPRPVQHVAEEISGQVPSCDSLDQEHFDRYLNRFPITRFRETTPDDQRPSSPGDAKSSANPKI